MGMRIREKEKEPAEGSTGLRKGPVGGRESKLHSIGLMAINGALIKCFINIMKCSKVWHRRRRLIPERLNKLN